MAEAPGRAGRPSFLVFVPLVVVVALGALFAFLLMTDRDPAALPSPLVGRPAPSTPMPPLADTPFPTRLAGPALVNVFASWCGPCRAEHPVLMALSREMPIHGIAYRDEPQKAAAFLAELGDPYTGIGLDPEGRAGLEWGVTAVPETFLIDREGRVAHVVRGPIDADAYAALVAAISALD